MLTMLLRDINPHVRFACRIFFKSEQATFNVFDCRLFYILKGTIEIELDGHKYTLSDGCVFYCSATSVYSIRSDGCELYSLNFDLTQKRNDICKCCPPTVLEPGHTSHFSEKDIIDDCDFLNDHLFIQSGGKHFDAISGIVNELAQKMIFYREKASAMLKDLLIDIHRLSQKTDKSTADAVETVIAYLHENFSKKISNEQLAAIVGYHEYHLNRLFVRDTGKTLHRYVLTMRISEAKRLLTNTEMSLSDIADAAGFSSNTHFAGCFKKMVGQSPSEYKASMKSKI